MAVDNLADRAKAYLQKLCVEIPQRYVGSEGNRAATEFFTQTAASFGFEIETHPFECMDWHTSGVDLSVGNERFEAFTSPYSRGCNVHAPLAALSTVEELEDAKVSGRIVLLYGDIASAQLMPKNFPFYNPDEHKRIIQLLEAKNPQAIIAATSRDVEMVGSLYPFPLIEDGDFDIPSVYMTDETGVRLIQHAGAPVSLESRAERTSSTGSNVIARKRTDSSRRVVLFAHIDSKPGTPGAADNAAGVTVLLLLAELLADYAGALGIELVAMNGEDYYSNPGEQQYLARNTGRFGEIVLGINIDGAGFYKGDTAYSLYECPAELADLVYHVCSAYAGIVPGESWYQGDHMLFLLNERPALAFTTSNLNDLMSEIVHTPQDTPDVVDPAKLSELARMLHDLLLRMNQVE